MPESSKQVSLSVGNIGENVAFKLPIPDASVLEKRDEDHYYLMFSAEDATFIARSLIESIQKVETGAWKNDLQ